ncbi:hypothetical protein AAVH_22185 [Aphelenchoides avenae]|nr:hypothetical protein AAVH_22185 [Aphelenchus avenae]
MILDPIALNATSTVEAANSSSVIRLQTSARIGRQKQIHDPRKPDTTTTTTEDEAHSDEAVAFS